MKGNRDGLSAPEYEDGITENAADDAGQDDADDAGQDDAGQTMRDRRNNPQMVSCQGSGAKPD